MHNDLYPDMVIGCLKARTVPVNVNYHYTPREVGELLEYVKPRAVIYHRSLGAKFADVLPRAERRPVDLGRRRQRRAGTARRGRRWKTLWRKGIPTTASTPSPDDLMMICTGGTTGRPKGVLWRQSDMYVASMNGADHESADEIHDKVRQRRAAVVRRVAADARGRHVDGVRRDS